MFIPPKRRTMPYNRPMSGVDWCLLAHPRGLAQYVQLCVEGEGAIDPEALAAAVAAASRACPGARLVRHGRQWADSGRAPTVRVVDAADFDRTRLDSPLLRRPLAGARAASCEVILVRGTPATVVFRAHHAVMDGCGAMLWQRQVFRALRGEAVEGATSRLTVDEVQAAVVAQLGRELPPRVPPPKQQWRSALGDLPKGPRRSMWRRRTIEGTHPAATAKIARLVATFGGVTGLVNIPVDLRPWLPGLRTTGLAGATIKVRIHDDDDWNDVQASLLTALTEQQYLAGSGDWSKVLKIPLPLLRALFSRLNTMARKNENIVTEKNLCRTMATVSHLGVVDLADFSAGGFEATSFYSLGSVDFNPEVDIVESPGRTEVTVAWYDAPGTAERAEALLDWIEKQLSPAGRRVWEGKRTGREAPPSTLTRLFAEQVRRSPGAVAVSSADGDLTYTELSQQADAVAVALRVRGISRGDRVGLVAERSPVAIAAIWGILKAGAAYLPIDASYPDARIVQLLTDAQTRICLLEPPSDQRDCLPVGCEGVSLDALPRSAPAQWRDVDGQPDDLACVIYTSGSTGVPKGVEIEHRSLVNYVRWATREAGIDASARMPLIASISFDMAGCAIFLPLLAGGTVLPVREVNAVTLRQVLEDGNATALAITPSHLDLINQAGIRRSSMRVVMTAGELLRRSTALRAREIFGPACRILCQWGPTETTIVNTSHEFDPQVDTDPGVPFGRPADNNTVRLLDSHGRSMPPGEHGEAYVGGVQVARGYLGRPDLTKQRFVRLADGTRAYRTGDIARLLPSGELAFVSRVDDQVKVAGHRIEPAEVAQVLEDHPEVRQAAVVPRTRPGRQDKELCAYVVCRSGIAAAELKEFLAGRLPRYMIPAAIIAVTEIPRNANGKTDVRQLPDPFAVTSSGDTAEDTAEDTADADRDDVTNAIASIWARTLQIDTRLMDEQADFHQLGGNSLLLLSMINEVSRSLSAGGQEEFMEQLSQIIREPTLGRVSDLVKQTQVRHPASQGAGLPFPRRGNCEPFPAGKV